MSARRSLIALVLTGSVLLSGCGGFSYAGSDDPAITETEREYLERLSDRFKGDPGEQLGPAGATAEEMIALGYISCVRTLNDFKAAAGRTEGDGIIALNFFGAGIVWEVANGDLDSLLEAPMDPSFCQASPRSMTDDEAVEILTTMRLRY